MTSGGTDGGGMSTDDRDAAARALGYVRVPGTAARYARPGDDRVLGVTEMEREIWEGRIREDGWHAFARSTRTSALVTARTHLASREEARAAARGMRGLPDVYVYAVGREGGRLVEREHSGSPHRGMREGV